jgi:hypothetical protein
MPTIGQIGSELAEVPVGDLLRSVAQGIADGQAALDLAAVQTLIALSQTTVDLIPEITEVISPETLQVQTDGDTIEVTGARVTATASDAVQLSALQAGLTPSFYQFAEATIQLKLSVQMREVRETQSATLGPPVLRAFASNVNMRTQNTFSYTAEASSSVTALLKPVPPPSRLVPTTITVNELVQPPTVTVNP